MPTREFFISVLFSYSLCVEPIPRFICRRQSRARVSTIVLTQKCVNHRVSSILDFDFFIAVSGILLLMVCNIISYNAYYYILYSI